MSNEVSNEVSNVINGIDTTGMHPDTIKALQQYSRPVSEYQQSPHQNWQLSQNGLNRTREMVAHSGLSREESRRDPAMMMRATLRALAEQRPALPRNEGIGGRNGLGTDAGAVRTGSSFAFMAQANANAKGAGK